MTHAPPARPAPARPSPGARDAPPDRASPPGRAAPSDREALRARFHAVRSATEALAAPLSPEDQQLQSMPSCSPTKWHRGHTTWFFEAFVLGPLGTPPHDPRFAVLFNSYYEALGPRHPRPHRGLLSRPTAAEVGVWRARVDERVDRLLTTADGATLARIAPLVTLGLAHEEQHQELLLTDILHAFAQNPLRPAYRSGGGPARLPAQGGASSVDPAPPGWVAFEEGPAEIGAAVQASAARAEFAFDNEGPRHRVWLAPYALATRLVTVGEARAFVQAGGYDTPSLWLSDGLDFVRSHGLRAPGYVKVEDGAWRVFGLDGLREARDDEPVAHLSFYEADALARFLGARLPTEAEWERAASGAPTVGNLRDTDALRPLPAAGTGLTQLYGDAWEWTASAYAPYPGYTPAAGAVGEYNGKFMVNQLVLRGGSCLTPPGHIRATYRNFWHPDTRFQVTGLRLARDLP
ncbi:MAG: ergothioneine biosynthesis protein EgtB [Pseudomonadota bacterium]|nr:ergothioneine biosynthesis protein EgtB [Pseudomonadota bacterium]